MLPVLSGTNRMSDKDIMLGGFLIPRNTMIWCNLNATMSNPAIWDNPEVFLPVSHNHLLEELLHYSWLPLMYRLVLHLIPAA